MYRVELDVFHDETEPSDWADSFDFGTFEFLTDAVINANAVKNRMKNPNAGVWKIEITNTETREQVIVHSNGQGVTSPARMVPGAESPGSAPIEL